jgi:hypothetical protein
MAKAIHPAPVRSNIPLSQPPRRVATPIGCDSIATGGSVQHVFSPPARNYHLRHIAPPGPRRQAKNALSYVPDTIMWLNAATPGLFRHLVHHSGNITGWFWHGDLPLSLGGCHAGETFTRVPPPSIASVSPGSPRQSSNTSGWMAERCYTHRSVSCRIPIVMNFGEFANAHGGQRSARSRPFVRAWVCKHIRGREQLANAVLSVTTIFDGAAFEMIDVGVVELCDVTIEGAAAGGRSGAGSHLALELFPLGRDQ